MKNDSCKEGGHGNYFATTRWSVVLASADALRGREEAHAALSELCRLYWRPIFAYVCHRGYQLADAQDLTQDFLLQVMEGSILKRADPNRGRFRALLCTSLQNFLHDAHDRKRAKKRGGDREFVSWSDWMAEAPSLLSMPNETIESWSAERVFDLRWAATVVERALRQLREECESRGRARAFDKLRQFLTGDGEVISYAECARTLGVSEASIKTVVHRLRLRYRSILRAEVAATLADPADLETEVRYLCSVLSVTP